MVGGSQTSYPECLLRVLCCKTNGDFSMSASHPVDLHELAGRARSVVGSKPLSRPCCNINPQTHPRLPFEEQIKTAVETQCAWQAFGNP
jgi:hypothetical protein